jgi:nitronate monooxygenase
MNFASGSSSRAKAWRDIWGSGQSVAGIHDVPPVSELVDRLEAEYKAAVARLERDTAGWST